MGIYPSSNDQTSQVIAALDKIIENYNNRSAFRAALLGARTSRLRLSSSSSSACRSSHSCKHTSTYSMCVILA